MFPQIPGGYGSGPQTGDKFGYTGIIPTGEGGFDMFGGGMDGMLAQLFMQQQMQNQNQSMQPYIGGQGLI